MAVNQQQIAEALNVSVMTVSRALRHHPDLAESTREMVLNKAEELGYYKHLKKRKGALLENGSQGAETRRMGILFFEDEILSHVDLFKSGVIRQIFLSLQKECQRFDVETVVEVTSSGSTELPRLIKNRSVEGVFLLGRYTHDTVKKFDGFPALAVSNFVESVGLPHVVADNFHGMYEATQHLIDLGHRKIIFVGDSQVNTRIFSERSFGYLSAMQTAGLSPKIVFFNHRKEPIPVDQIMEHTGVVCSNDSQAYAVKKQLASSGAEIPRDCSLVSFDNIEALHERGAITSYGPNWDLLGRAAVGLMVSTSQAIMSHEIAITVPGRLVVQNSTAAPRE